MRRFNEYENNSFNKYVCVNVLIRYTDRFNWIVLSRSRLHVSKRSLSLEHILLRYIHQMSTCNHLGNMSESDVSVLIYFECHNLIETKIIV